MIRIFLFFVFLTSIVFGNPYKSIDPQTQLSIMINHFFNEQIKETFPQKPVKDIYVEEEADLNPGKYERYYNYVQRLKAIEQTRKDELQKIEEKFKGQAAYYNSKLDAIKNQYEKKQNISSFLQRSINNGFKVVYGKPVVSEFQNKEKLVEAKLSAISIYKNPKNTLDIPIIFENNISLKHKYEKYPVLVSFKYDGEYLIIDEVKLSINDKQYRAKLKNENNGKIKLKVKINDDIFQKIKIEENR